MSSMLVRPHQQQGKGTQEAAVPGTLQYSQSPSTQDRDVTLLITGQREEGKRTRRRKTRGGGERNRRESPTIPFKGIPRVARGDLPLGPVS